MDRDDRRPRCTAATPGGRSRPVWSLLGDAPRDLPARPKAPSFASPRVLLGRSRPSGPARAAGRRPPSPDTVGGGRRRRRTSLSYSSLPDFLCQGGGCCYRRRGRGPLRALQQAFTAEGKRGPLSCLFSPTQTSTQPPHTGDVAMGSHDLTSALGDPTPHSSSDPICTAITEDVTAVPAQAASQCLIRFLDKHSPEVARYVGRISMKFLEVTRRASVNAKGMKSK